jgi:hypothetical protein
MSFWIFYNNLVCFFVIFNVLGQCGIFYVWSFIIFTAICYVLSHSVYFHVIWYISPFWYVLPIKSGNPDAQFRRLKNRNERNSMYTCTHVCMYVYDDWFVAWHKRLEAWHRDLCNVCIVLKFILKNGEMKS